MGFSKYQTKNQDDTFSTIRIADLRVGVLDNASKYTLFRKVDDTTTIPYNSSADLFTTTYGPDIKLAAEGNYVIDGYYTEYAFNKSTNLDPHVNDKNYLVLGGVVTDYQVSEKDIKSSKTITSLPLTHLIFLIMLCAVAGPLMKLLQNMVPWILKQVRALKKFLIKLQ